MKFISTLKHLLPGLALVALITFAARYLAALPFFQSISFGPHILGILLGLLLTNVVYLPGGTLPGIGFSTKLVLRLAIILLGLKITLFDIFAIGPTGLAVDVFMVASTAILGIWLGTRVLRLDTDTSILVSAGSAICGASAVLATEGTLNSKPHKAALAVGTVTLFGTIMMFLLPTLQNLGILGLSEQSFGIFAGATTHEVAQAVAAGFTSSNIAGETAVITKLLRVVLLIPFLLGVIWWLRQDKAQHHAPVPFPWFVLGFVAVSVLYTFLPLPEQAVDYLLAAQDFLMTMAMTALGLKTKYRDLVHVGWLPILLGLILTCWLILGGFGAVSLASYIFG